MPSKQPPTRQTRRDPKGPEIEMTPAMTMLGEVGRLIVDLGAAKERLSPRKNSLVEITYLEKHRVSDIMVIQGLPKKSTAPLYREMDKRGHDTLDGHRRYAEIEPMGLPPNLAKKPVGFDKLRKALDEFLAANPPSDADYEPYDEEPAAS